VLVRHIHIFNELSEVVLGNSKHIIYESLSKQETSYNAYISDDVCVSNLIKQVLNEVYSLCFDKCSFVCVS